MWTLYSFAFRAELRKHKEDHSTGLTLVDYDSHMQGTEIRLIAIESVSETQDSTSLPLIEKIRLKIMLKVIILRARLKFKFIGGAF